MTPFIRIGLRYFAMFLVVRGWLSEDDATSIVGDHELISLIEMGIGFVLVGATEIWHWIVWRWQKAMGAVK
ncbi:hypothetical protein [Nitratireductor indicus]|uniref:hypothetical protein n=1 Tax=Nitratireductor indicus TaxID=721133 RepID=UPI002876682D|nr:hypothetical protein [Nitratireductor indicus]MDS1138572.1 hypothetical protein [Nitratireductor indicus]